MPQLACGTSLKGNIFHGKQIRHLNSGSQAYYPLKLWPFKAQQAEVPLAKQQKGLSNRLSVFLILIGCEISEMENSGSACHGTGYCQSVLILEIPSILSGCQPLIALPSFHIVAQETSLPQAKGDRPSCSLNQTSLPKGYAIVHYAQGGTVAVNGPCPLGLFTEHFRADLVIQAQHGCQCSILLTSLSLVVGFSEVSGQTGWSDSAGLLLSS